MAEPLSIVLVGIGGYGKRYVNAILDADPSANVRIAGTVDPRIDGCDRWDDLRKLGVPHFRSLEDFYLTQSADLAVIASPIQFHAEQTCLALQNSSHVLCEKPLCCSTEDAARMADAQKRYNRHVAIGFQWSFSGAIHELKADIMSGRFGAPKRLRCITLWPRDRAYYERNDWAGTSRDAAGRPVFDSPVNNACAHGLHNMLYALGRTTTTSATPARVEAELFRANAIDNYDTAVLRCQTDTGVPVLFVTSHSVRGSFGPIFSYEFENATINYAEEEHAIIKATFNTGSTICYGSPAEPEQRKLWRTIDAIRGGKQSLCSVDAAAAHAQAAALAQQSPRGIINFPRRLVRTIGEATSRTVVVQGLDAALRKCYDQFALPSELGFAWAAEPTPKLRGRSRTTPTDREVAA
jgi:predicted dehydrogenase